MSKVPRPSAGDERNVADTVAPLARKASAGLNRRGLVVGLAGVVGTSVSGSLFAAHASPANATRLSDENAAFATLAASGTTLAWIETVLGMVTSTSSTGARTGELASNNSSGLGNAILVFAKGCLSAGDGGGGLFYWQSGNVTGDDGGTIIVPNTNPSGRWVRIYSGALNVQWFGAVGDGLQDDTLAIQNAIDALRPNATSNVPSGAVYIPTGTYLAMNTLKISNDRTHVFGDGRWASSVVFSPSVPSSPLFAFGKSSEVLYQCSLSHLALSSGNGVAKVAVRLTDTSGFALEDVVIYNWSSSSPSTPSMGVQLLGREMTLVSRLECSADSPIWIGQNPHAPRTVLEDCDHLHMRDLYLMPEASHHCVTIDSGVNVSNLVIDGTNAFVGGKDGLHWSDSSATVASLNISIGNIRREQTVGVGWTVYVSHNFGLINLRLENIECDSSGVSLHNVSGVNLDSCVFISQVQPHIALDSTCGEFEWTSCYFQAGGTANISGMTEAFSVPKIAVGAPLPPSGRLINNTYASTTPSRIWGAYTIRHTGTLANGSSFRIPSILNGYYEVAVITIATHNPTSGISEGGVFLFTTQTVAALGATSNTSTGNVAGKICLDWISNNEARMINNLTAPVDYLISVEYKR